MERQDALTLAALPLLGIWLLVARILSMLTPLLAPWLSYLLAQRLYYATPFAVYALRSGGGAKAILTRLGFEASYCMNGERRMVSEPRPPLSGGVECSYRQRATSSVYCRHPLPPPSPPVVVRRYLTLPLRPHLPHFYIVGFPKCGTTSMCTYLKQHPCIDGLDGLPYHEILEKWVGRVSGSGAVGTLGGGWACQETQSLPRLWARLPHSHSLTHPPSLTHHQISNSQTPPHLSPRESHFYVGALGRSSTTSTSAYRSFFPTIVASTLARVRHGNWLCFDACPVHACLPHVPARMKAMTPNAKLVFMMRDPLAAVISGELMVSVCGTGCEEPGAPADIVVRIQLLRMRQWLDTRRLAELLFLWRGERLICSKPIKRRRW